MLLRLLHHPDQCRRNVRFSGGCILRRHVLLHLSSVHIDAVRVNIQLFNGLMQHHRIMIEFHDVHPFSVTFFHPLNGQSQSFHGAGDLIHIGIGVHILPFILAPDLHTAADADQYPRPFSSPANSRKCCRQQDSSPCLSTSTVAAPARKKRANCLASLLIRGNEVSFCSKAFQSSLAYTNKQPSIPGNHKFLS